MLSESSIVHVIQLSELFTYPNKIEFTGGLCHYALDNPRPTYLRIVSSQRSRTKDRRSQRSNTNLTLRIVVSGVLTLKIVVPDVLTLRFLAPSLRGVTSHTIPLSETEIARRLAIIANWRNLSKCSNL